MSAAAPSFARDTAVRGLGGGSYAAEVPSHWLIGRGPNGGWVAAVVLRALLAALDDLDRAPRSLTLHFLEAPHEGPLRIDTQVQRSGRSLSSLSARVEQEGRPVVLALAAFGVARPGPEYDDAARPDGLPGPPESTAISGETAGAPTFLANYDLRWALGPLPGAGQPGPIGGWVRPAAPHPLDPVLLAALTDVWAPALFSRTATPHAAPTLDLTIHFRAAPPPDADPAGYVFGSFVTRKAAEGYWEEDGELYGPDGRLLVQSRQLALAIPVG